MKRNAFGLSMLLGATLFVGCGPEAAQESGDEAVRTEAAPKDVDEVLAALGYCDDVASPSSSWVTMENQILTLVNQKRAAGATCGGVKKAATGALTMDSRLRCAARKHSKDLGQTNTFSHTGSNGSSPWDRMKSAGYTSYSQAAENIAAGGSTAADTMNQWMNSEGHCNNIMAPGLTQIGVGYFNAPNSTYKHYWTQDFGRP
jgi:uncharacterized protein YkwD